MATAHIGDNAKDTPYASSPPPDRVHQHRPHDHPLQLADPAYRRAGDGGSRRPVRLVVWPDPGPRHRHVRALRPAVAAAGLAGATLRPQDPDDRVLPGHRSWPDRRRSRSFPTMLAIALAFAGGFAAIYHPIGTTMLVEAAGEKPGRSIGVNGVFGNLGVALAPVVTAFLAHAFSWRAAFIAPGLFCVAVGLLWMRTPPVPAHLRHVNRRPFPPIPRHLVRRAVLVLMLIAMTSGLVFNAFTLLLPKLLQERLAGNANLLPLIGLAAFVVTLCGALTQFSVGRMIDRNTLKRVFLPVSIVLAPAMLALSFAQGWLVLPLAAAVAASIFGQVTVNDTMAARYISPALRARIYSVRFFVGFLGAAAAAPVLSILYERTGSVAAVTTVLAVFSVVTLGCALFFPDRKEELEPELWADASDAAEEFALRS